MIYTCCDGLRRNAVHDHPTLNGIDYLEVLDGEAPSDSPPQRTLLLKLLKPVPDLTPENVRILGGERVSGIRAEWVAPASAVPAPPATAAEVAYFSALPEPDLIAVIRTDSAGDFSTYTLQLVHSALDPSQPANFDPQLICVDFSFKVECPSDFDCKSARICAEPPREEPDVDYLAKDYASFRRLILSRISQLVPGWKESSPADLGVALAELMAYVGDHLSYEQDAVATEAYLETARRRSSLRRHALLVDYHMHDGCNARAWLHLEVRASGFKLPQEGLQFYTRTEGLPPRLVRDSQEDKAALRAKPEVFEVVRDLEHGITQDVTFYQEHNKLNFYTWGDRRCCLPRGAARATLLDHYPNLAPGDVLVFEEVKGPLTGNEEDADPLRRHAVRLATVRAFQPDAEDHLVPLTDPLDGTQITEISWHEDDALPFPLCISVKTDEQHGGMFIDNVSVARGNILLVHHSRTVKEEDLGTVPEPHLALAPAAESQCTPDPQRRIPPRYRPRLAQGPLTQVGTVIRIQLTNGRPERQRVPFDPGRSAASATHWRVADALPAIELASRLDSETHAWHARRDLLSSDGSARDFVVETEHDGSAFLRFGDDTHGERPDPSTRFTATYRIGNGIVGNVGAETITHIVTTNPDVTAVRNPLPATGGLEPETTAEVRRRAPQAFRTQERAVTPEDYAEMAMRDPTVQRAAGTPRWTGSWHTMFLTVDRRSGKPVDDAFEEDLRRALEPYRMAGHDLEVDAPQFVALELDLDICVKPDYFRADVRKALTETLSNRDLPDGRSGLFHPDRFTFGQSVYLSRVYAAAHAVTGVASLVVTKFQRQGTDTGDYLASGELPLGRLEIARLDNDPNYPERGVLRLTLNGGK